MTENEFDTFADDYESALQQGLAVSGESAAYFAEARVAWTRHVCRHQRHDVRRVIDFGCGTGATAPFFFDLLAVEQYVGVDVSESSLAVARRDHKRPAATFLTHHACPPEPVFDLAYCNGVFHHIPVVQRPAAVDYVRQRLRTGGLFAFWENNPLNPGTRLVMKRIPFDRDAITLMPWEARRLLHANGFEVLQTDYRFYFPRWLAWFRPLERGLVRLPLGAQYLVLCRKR